MSPKGTTFPHVEGNRRVACDSSRGQWKAQRLLTEFARAPSYRRPPSRDLFLWPQGWPTSRFFVDSGDLRGAELAISRSDLSQSTPRPHTVTLAFSACRPKKRSPIADHNARQLGQKPLRSSRVRRIATRRVGPSHRMWGALSSHSHWFASGRRSTPESLPATD